MSWGRISKAPLVLVSALCSLPAATSAQTTDDPLAPLLRETRPFATRLQTDYSAAIALGLGYTSDSNFMFGQYNGLHEEQTHIIGNLHWNNFQDGKNYWQVSATNLGLDTREAAISWGRADRLKVSIELDSQLQVRNNSGATPFRGDSTLRLPANWVSGNNTSGWTALDESLKSFDRELERTRYALEINARINDSWKLESRVMYEDKQGTADLGAAIFIDAASGDSSLLPAPVDYRTTEFEFGLVYQGKDLQLNGRLSYSDFDNKEDTLRWQNPYNAFGPDVSYPNGEGALGLAPDNQRIGARLSGQYLFSNSARLQFDGSYATTTQDQNYLPYTVNPALTVSTPLPREKFDGEISTGTFNTKVLIRPHPKLKVEATYKLRDRDYDAPRDGYRYVPGDGANQSRKALTVYNTLHDYLSQTVGFEISYRLPLHSKLTFDYEFEDIRRENAAVEQTEEDRYTLRYRIAPWPQFNARLEILYADRAADNYQWDQSYYALLDSELINATPDTQRYQNHPKMSQFNLSNRERWEGKLDLTYQPGVYWSLNLNLLRRNDEYDKSELGLTDTGSQRLHLSASYSASQNSSVSLYAGYDEYESDQSSRAFRGGIEKNAFEVTPPLPQASDPGRNWDVKSRDSSFTLGTNFTWQLRPHLELEMDYSFVDSSGEQDFKTFGASDLLTSDLPKIETRMHHLQASGIWHLRETLSIQVDYQYYRYKSDDWALQGVKADTLSKVLSFGDRNPNEQIHYLGTSVIYRWQ